MGSGRDRGTRRMGIAICRGPMRRHRSLPDGYHPEPRAYYQRKRQKTNAVVAHSALAHKLARAAYYVMRDRVPFDSEKLFR